MLILAHNSRLMRAPVLRHLLDGTMMGCAIKAWS